MEAVQATGFAGNQEIPNHLSESRGSRRPNLVGIQRCGKRSDIVINTVKVLVGGNNRNGNWLWDAKVVGDNVSLGVDRVESAVGLGRVLIDHQYFTGHWSIFGGIVWENYNRFQC